VKQPWIKSPAFDCLWFLAPGILPVLCVFIFPDFFRAQALSISVVSWIWLVLLIDVAHVYSTVYRTYFNKTASLKFSTLFKAVPLICWVVGVLLYSINGLMFWRCLAYLAVFHFIRQQYGFLRIYSRNQSLPQWMTVVHTITIYAVTLLPILIWHAQGLKNFNWFVENDFIYFNSPLLAKIFTVLFFSVIVVYFLTELFLFIRMKLVNIPRLLLVTGTALSWYIGIVLFNGDLTFTLLNVVAHGIPYMALIWVSEKEQAPETRPGILKYLFKTYGVLLFVGLLIAFAYFEEGLWDALVWREHESVFKAFYILDPVHNSKLLCFLVPLLSLPQSVHYVLDGFIWRRNKKDKTVGL
jgi:hypothetical protein